ncbi:hypothetical protein Pan44_11680 [Caulifigura coniformis]|uniref:Translational regulator CsrA n=1 Tax=Caulifigura coniformis TaxID=2527983 RepID=A0A517SAL1_9PLAN|nr:carbon storage regulator [Caulifigura coniformis]QDT53153.1 hypothetical protein Pan44_11680 [Caulifigura coniformis]
MLVLGRKVEEAILLDGGRIRISILEVHGGRVKLGIEAPREVNVQREGAGFHERVPACSTFDRG